MRDKSLIRLLSCMLMIPAISFVLFFGTTVDEANAQCRIQNSQQDSASSAAAVQNQQLAAQLQLLQLQQSQQRVTSATATAGNAGFVSPTLSLVQAPALSQVPLQARLYVQAPPAPSLTTALAQTQTQAPVAQAPVLTVPVQLAATNQCNSCDRARVGSRLRTALQAAVPDRNTSRSKAVSVQRSNGKSRSRSVAVSST